MTPSALLGKLVGTDSAIASGRLLTVVAGTASVTLGGLLARHRGVFAVLVAGGLPAVFPDSIQAAHTVLVEPWLALFCLAGALAVFEGDRLTACHRRLVWGGVAFGFAGAVEVWAIFPLVVIAALSLRAPRRLARYLAGAAAGFLVPVLPLAIIAPRGLYQGLVVAQVGGRYHPRRVPNWYRVKEMVGLSDFHVTHATPQFCGRCDRGVRCRRARPGLLGDPAPPDRTGVVCHCVGDPGGGRVHVAQSVPLPLPRVPGAVPRPGHSLAIGPAYRGRPGGRRRRVRPGTGVGGGTRAARPGTGVGGGTRAARPGTGIGGGTRAARPGGGRPRSGCSGPRPGWRGWRSSPWPLCRRGPRRPSSRMWPIQRWSKHGGLSPQGPAWSLIKCR